jgi:hypothetical protein
VLVRLVLGGEELLRLRDGDVGVDPGLALGELTVDAVYCEPGLDGVDGVLLGGKELCDLLRRPVLPEVRTLGVRDSEEFSCRRVVVSIIVEEARSRNSPSACFSPFWTSPIWRRIVLDDRGASGSLVQPEGWWPRVSTMTCVELDNRWGEARVLTTLVARRTRDVSTGSMLAGDERDQYAAHTAARDRDLHEVWNEGDGWRDGGSEARRAHAWLN